MNQVHLSPMLDLQTPGGQTIANPVKHKRVSLSQANSALKHSGIYWGLRGPRVMTTSLLSQLLLNHPAMASPHRPDMRCSTLIYCKSQYTEMQPGIGGRLTLLKTLLSPRPRQEARGSLHTEHLGRSRAASPVSKRKTGPDGLRSSKYESTRFWHWILVNGISRNGVKRQPSQVFKEVYVACARRGQTSAWEAVPLTVSRVSSVCSCINGVSKLLNKLCPTLFP